MLDAIQGIHDNPDAFQLQLINQGNGDFDVVMRYEAINWISADGTMSMSAKPALPLVTVIILTILNCPNHF